MTGAGAELGIVVFRLHWLPLSITLVALRPESQLSAAMLSTPKYQSIGLPRLVGCRVSAWIISLITVT